MALRALIFDFDGLIIDTETPEVQTWREIFASYGVEFPDIYWQNSIGRGAEQITETPVQLLARIVDQPIDETAVHRKARRDVLAQIHAATPRPGIVSLLDDAKRKGLGLGVASSSKHAWVDNLLDRVGLAHYFDFTTCADDVARAKPFPDLYELACRRLEVAPHEAIALEDSANGVAAARAANLFVIAYPNSVTRFLDLSAASHRFDDLQGIGVETLAKLLPMIVEDNA